MDAVTIRDVTLSDIIRRNTDTFTIQDTAFSLQNEGTDGDDELNGGLGDDLISGASGNDLIFGRQANDWLNGNGGNDRLFGDEGNDGLDGGSGDDDLYGGDGDDILIGGDGADLLFGTQRGVSAQGEVDVLTGGGGADFFVLGNENVTYYNDGDRYAAGLSDYALITDFNSQEDQILLHGSRSQYQLATTASGTDILYLESGSYAELIATVSHTALSLDSHYFLFA